MWTPVGSFIAGAMATPWRPCASVWDSAWRWWSRLTETFPVPGWLAEHARSFYAAGGPPCVPRRASTVVLLRTTANGFEVYAIRRVPTMAFAANMYAFP